MTTESVLSSIATAAWNIHTHKSKEGKGVLSTLFYIGGERGALNKKKLSLRPVKAFVLKARTC